MTKPKIIMDVDTGTDDAVALTLAMLGGEVELLGVTTVNGNLELKLTTDNTLRVVDYCGKGDQVKVYSGCEYPLVSTLSPTTRVGSPSAAAAKSIRATSKAAARFFCSVCWAVPGANFPRVSRLRTSISSTASMAAVYLSSIFPPPLFTHSIKFVPPKQPHSLFPFSEKRTIIAKNDFSHGGPK